MELTNIILPKDIILLLLGEAGEKGLSMREVQNIIYSIQKRAKMGYKFIFTPYERGPWSWTIYENLMEIRDLKLVEVSGNEDGKDIAKLRFVINEAGQWLVNDLKIIDKYPTLVKEIKHDLEKMIEERNNEL